MIKSIFWLILVPALLPVFLVFWYVYSKDKYEREPLSLVLKTMFFGALFTPVCIPIENLFDYIISYFFGYDALLYDFIENIVGVAVVEELVKFAVLMIFIWKNENFDYRYDGIVYAVSASLGFAALENVLYIVHFGTGVSIGRAVFSIPGHAAFGVFMGFYLSRAKHWHLRGIWFLKIVALLFCVAIPVAIHGMYDFLLSDTAQERGWQNAFYVFVLILDWLACRIIRHEFRRDRPLGR